MSDAGLMPARLGEAAAAQAATAEARLSRAGRLACLCPDDLAPDDLAAMTAVRPEIAAARAALAFGLSVLSQVLALSVLPLAGAMLAAAPERAGWPFAAMLLGTVAASLPASVLRDAFGRRAAFALGAGIGAAGGIAAAWAVAADLFALLAIGAFWLGIAQGFGLAYRHDALALPPGWRERGGYLIFASGAAAGILAPAMLRAAEAAAAPIPFAGTLLAAGAVQVAVLALAVAPFRHARSGPQDESAPAAAWRGWLLPTVLSAFAWAGMTRAMAVAPGMLVGCGVSASGIAGFVAWHVVAMYAPALAGPVLSRALGSRTLALSGTGLVGLGLAVLWQEPSAAGIAAALAATGAGWCLATTGATALLHARGFGRWQLGLHDAAIVLGALAGALLR